MLARAASGAAAAAAPMRTLAVQQVRTMAITAEAVRIHSHGKAESVMKCVETCTIHGLLPTHAQTLTVRLLQEGDRGGERPSVRLAGPDQDVGCTSVAV